MTVETGNFPLFLGHFHPLLVHLPIGSLILLGSLELLAGLTRWKEAAQNNQLILGFAAVSACAAAACGWLLARPGVYDSRLLHWHRALGLGVTAGCLLCLGLRYRGHLRAYRIILASTLLVLGLGSHLGGSLTHGSDFLTRYAPTPLRPLLGVLGAQQLTTSPVHLSPQQPVFAGLIQPILRERCGTCHGSTKHKADLRLDNLDGLLRGGEDGPVIKPRQAKDSLLIQRILLPLEAEGHMPPESHGQMTVEEIALLQWWVGVGASATATLAELKPEPEIKGLLETVAKRPNR